MRALKSRKQKRIAFIDVGHDMLRMFLLGDDQASVSAYQTKSAGLSKGKLVDRESFTRSFRALIDLAQIKGEELRAFVSVPTLPSRILRRTIHHRCSGQYRSSDYDSIYESASDCSPSDLDEVIDVWFCHTQLDNNTIDPLSFGQRGRDLKAQAILITHPKILLADFVSAINDCSVEITEFRSSFIGLAHALKFLRPGIENAVLLDMGHSVTSGVMVIGGSVQQFFNVAAARHHITRDLAAGLNESLETSEALKKKHGLNPSSSAPDLAPYLRPRIAEIIALSFKNFALYAKALDGGLMFCGNGSQLPGLSSFAEKSTGVSSPFICHLTAKTATSFLDMKISNGLGLIDAGWLVLCSQLRSHLEEDALRQHELDDRPLAKLRPLWTWLSELSR
jgi:cell division ATPase FtsA